MACKLIERPLFQLVTLFFCFAITTYSRSALGAVQESMRASASLSDNEVALLLGPALSIPGILFGIPFGLFIDRHRRVPWIVGFAFLAAAGTALTGLAPSFGGMLLARIVVGLTITLMTIGGFSVLADLYPAAQRGRAKSALVVGQAMGNASAFALGGALLGSLGTTGNGWRSAMLWLAVPLALASVTLLLMREPARRGSGQTSLEPVSTIDSFRAIVRHRLILPLMTAIIALDFSLVAVTSWAAPAIARSFGLPPQRVGVIMGTALLISGLIGPILGGVVADICQRYDRPQRAMLVITFLALVGAPCGGFALVSWSWGGAATLLLLFTTISAAVALGMTLFTVVIPSEIRGLCLSLLVTAATVFAGVFAPLAVSSLAVALGGPPMIGAALCIICATANVIAAVACLAPYFLMNDPADSAPGRLFMDVVEEH